MTYADSDSNLDQVRDLIGDVSGDEDTEFLSDDEVNREITRAGSNIFLAASRCAGKIAARYAIHTNFSVGKKSKSKDQIFQHFKQLEKDLKAQASESSMGSIAAPTISQIQDSISTNFPPRQRITDIKPQPFGDDTVELDA